ncbi:DUF2064 domain-containing protein [Aurantibacter sp.]|uniref:TIGR04282 family arsenosugar biosynthesis glycosyltransferase n=1 Tax=Aurantibacter sp. TaxID=2807103 RepID=UPI003266CBA6
MNSNQKNTALLVFSLSAEQEVRRKSIFGHNAKKENSAFFNLLIKQTKELAANSGVDVFWVDEHQQQGVDFGTRFSNAFQNIFDAGYENVVSIGNDCPDLSVEVLNDAIQKLERNNLVFGPTQDGGVYLLGINKIAFEQQQLVNLLWQTSKLRSSIECYADSNNFTFDALSTFIDLDTEQDVQYYAKYNSSSLLSRFYKAVIALLKRTFKNFIPTIPCTPKYSHVGLRAPPTV